jgi:hypothetical protein
MFDNDPTAPHIELIKLVNELVNERHNTHGIVKTGKTASTTHSEDAHHDDHHDDHHRVLATTSTEESQQAKESHASTSKVNTHSVETHIGATDPPIPKDAHVIKLDMQKSFFATVPLNGN